MYATSTDTSASYADNAALAYQQYYPASEPQQQQQEASSPASFASQSFYDYSFSKSTSPADSNETYYDQNAYQNYAQYYQTFNGANNQYYYGNGSQNFYPNYYYQQPASATAQVKPSTSPAPTAGSYAFQTSLNSTGNTDSTPEKPILNDSGIDVISPQLQLQMNQLHLTSSYLEKARNSNQNNPSCEFQQSHFSISPALTRPEPTATVQIEIKEERHVESEQETKQVESQQDENDDQSISDADIDGEEEQAVEMPAAKKSSKNNGKDVDPCKPPKPYLEIIANAILSNKNKMMQLHEIYNFMENQYPYFARNINKSWRNSVRHNLSLNECFSKACRGSNGKGNYWRIHPLCEREFIRGNFRRKSFKQLIRAGQANQRQQAPAPEQLGAQFGHQAYSLTHPSLSSYPYPLSYAFNYKPMSGSGEQILNAPAHSIYGQSSSSNDSTSLGGISASSHHYRPY